MDLSNVDRLELRRKIAADIEKGKTLMAAREMACEPVEVDKCEAFRKLREKHEAERNELEDLFDAKLAAAEAPHREALDAWLEYDYGAPVRTDDDFEPIICAASGLPVFEDDQVIEDADTGEFYLRAALGLPPLETPDEDAAAAEPQSAYVEG